MFFVELHILQRYRFFLNKEARVRKKFFCIFAASKKVSFNFKPTILWEEHLNLEKQENLNVGVTWPEPLPA